MKKLTAFLAVSFFAEMAADSETFWKKTRLVK